MIKVNLARAYRYRGESGAMTTYGPGDTEIPEAMAQGLVDAGLLNPDVMGPQPPDRKAVAIETIAKRWGVPAPKDGDMTAFLEEMATIQPGPRISEILEIEGLSKTSIKAIQKHYGVEEDGDTA